MQPRLFQSPGFANYYSFSARRSVKSLKSAEFMGGINIRQDFYFLTPGLYTSGLFADVDDAKYE